MRSTDESWSAFYSQGLATQFRGYIYPIHVVQSCYGVFYALNCAFMLPNQSDKMDGSLGVGWFSQPFRVYGWLLMI